MSRRWTRRPFARYESRTVAISTAFAYCSAIAADRGLVLVGDDGKVDRGMTHWLLVREAFAMLAKDSE